METPLRTRIEGVLATLREGIAMHGGVLELVDVDEATGTVSIRLGGACVGCPLVDTTFHEGVEEVLTALVPEVKHVIRVDEEASHCVP
jgi:Fe-S cluster biogenesis protein NfuA